LLAVGAAVGGVVVLVVAGVVLALAVVGVVLAAAAVVGVVVVGAAVVEVELGAVVVVELELFDEDEFDFLAGEALGVLEPQAAAIRPPASTMVPRSQRARFRLGCAFVVPGVTRANPNTYCSSHRCGAPSAKLGGANCCVGSFLTAQPERDSTERQTSRVPGMNP
jgi:hypothetical protein